MEYNIGFDPGLRHTGYTVVEVTDDGYRLEAFGIFKTRPKTPQPESLYDIYMAVSDLIDSYEPTTIAIEAVYQGARRTSISGTCAVIGIIELASYIATVDSVQISPSHVKKFMCGNGRAKKDEVGNAVREKLIDGWRLSDNHEADSAAVILTALMEK